MQMTKLILHIIMTQRTNGVIKNFKSLRDAHKQKSKSINVGGKKDTNGKVMVIRKSTDIDDFEKLNFQNVFSSN